VGGNGVERWEKNGEERNRWMEKKERRDFAPLARIYVGAHSPAMWIVHDERASSECLKQYKNLAIANRSCVSCAHNTLRASSIGLNITQ